ncbi:MAG: hypothetical protein ABGW87_13015 [Sphingomonadaceae bacterium]
MPTFRLEYKDDMHGVAKYLDFEALDAGAALKIAKQEAKGRWGRLSQDGQFLCDLEHLDSGDANLWVVSPSGEHALP